MRQARLILASLVLGILALPSLASASGNGFTTDPELEARLVQVRLVNFFRLELRYRVVNNSHSTVTGPTRLLVDTRAQVLNADGFDDGTAFINVCRSDECSLEPGDRSRRVRVRLPLFQALFLGFGVDAQFQPFVLQLLHNADMDGNGSDALENVERFSGLLADFQAEYPDNTVTLSSGDNYIPGPRYNAAAEVEFTDLLGVPGVGRLDMAYMNAMGYEASAVGNHELDDGTAVFASIFGADGDYPGAQFPYLSSNLDFTSDANLVGAVVADGQEAATITNSLARSTVITVDGEKIGIVGATTPTLTFITDSGDITVLPPDFTSDNVAALAGEIQPAIDALTLQGINKIIMLGHMQRIAIEQELATLLTDVDLIVAGGSNTRLVDENDRLRPGEEALGVYPGVFTSPKGEPVLVVNTDGDYKYLGRLVSAFTLAGTINLESLDTTVNGAYATDADSYAFFGSPAANPAVVALSDAARETLARINEPVGLTEVFLSAQREPGVRTEETTLGNLTADANLVAAKKVDPSVVISLKNGGGIRADIGSIVVPPGATEPEFLPPPDGEITRLDIESTLAFNNGLVLLTITSNELRAFLEGSLGAPLGPTPNQLSASGGFPQVAGISVSYDPNLPSGSRVISAVVDNNGTPVDLVVNGVTQQAGSFRLVTLDFLADGGDGTLGTLSAPNRVDLEVIGEPAGGPSMFSADGSEQDALAEYLIETFPLDGSNGGFNQQETAPNLDTRITNVAF
ncbi:MAG: bifunctional metallophosphatase/5'-nucleotidase [Pseudomonadota bacterium]